MREKWTIQHLRTRDQVSFITKYSVYLTNEVMLTTKIDHDKLFLWSSQDPVYILTDLNRRNQNIMHEVVINVPSMNPNMTSKTVSSKRNFIWFISVKKHWNTYQQTYNWLKWTNLCFSLHPLQMLWRQVWCRLRHICHNPRLCQRSRHQQQDLFPLVSSPHIAINP